MSFRRFLIGVLSLLAMFLIAARTIYRSIPQSNTSQTRFDTLIVLGTPANTDGTPSPEQRERTLEAVREYKAGIAPHIIFTGGAAHNSFVEAEVMQQLAQSQGIPPDAMVEEPQAQNTIQNIFFSEKIMQARGWKSAEVISSPSHLPRAAMILQHYRFPWRTHAAPWPPEYTWCQQAAHFAVEETYCMRLRILGFPKTVFLPTRAPSP